MKTKSKKMFPTVLKELLHLCTKPLHFTFNTNIYIQRDGVAMGSPLGPLVTNTLMESVQEDPIPTLTEWKIGTLRNLSK